MAYLDDKRENVVREIAESFRNSVTPADVETQDTGAMVDRAEMLRLSRLVQTLASELGQYSELVEYAKDVTHGREALDFAIENLSGVAQNNVLIFFGQRRIGKSSILYRLMETPLRDEYMFVYIACQGFGEADTAKLLYQICRKIHSTARKNQITLDRPNQKKFKENPFLELDEYLDVVESTLEEKHLALLFDDYEFLEYKVRDGKVSPDIFDKLHNLIQQRSKLAFIFAGTHRLTELTEDYWSILFNTAPYHEIRPLDNESATALITEPVKGYLYYDDLAIDKILRVTGLHPYFLQVTCHLLVNYCNKRKVNFVTLAIANNVLEEVVEASTTHVKYLFRNYSAESEQEIMTFLSRVTDESKNFASVTEIERVANENGFSYDRKQIMEVLASLKNKRFVKEGSEIRGDLYGFEVELLGFWIKKHVTIQRGFITLM